MVSDNNEKRCIIIDFLYLDLTTCTRCQGTDESLDEAIVDVSKVLEATGVEVIVNKINVTSEELAIKYKFVSSPTIRVNWIIVNRVDTIIKENFLRTDH